MRCGEPILAGQKYELDHVVPVCEGGRAGPTALSHAFCNRSHGGRMGRRRQLMEAAMLEGKFNICGLEVVQYQPVLWGALLRVPEPPEYKISPKFFYATGAQIVGRLVDMHSVNDLDYFYIDGQSPSKVLAYDLRAVLADTVRSVTASDHVAALYRFNSLLAAGRLDLRDIPEEADAAAQHALSRRLAGGEALDRYGSSESVAPLAALVWAVHGLFDAGFVDGDGAAAADPQAYVM